MMWMEGRASTRSAYGAGGRIARGWSWARNHRWRKLADRFRMTEVTSALEEALTGKLSVDMCADVMMRNGLRGMQQLEPEGCEDGGVHLPHQHLADHTTPSPLHRTTLHPTQRGFLHRLPAPSDQPVSVQRGPSDSESSSISASPLGSCGGERLS
jgi:hypothetical protein